jgi:hypothetical protein
MGSNPTRGIDVCLYLFCVCVVLCGNGLASGWSTVQGVLPTPYKIHSFIINSEWEQAREPNPSRWKKYLIGQHIYIYIVQVRMYKITQFNPDINTSFQLTSCFMLLEILSQPYIFCLKNSMAVSAVMFRNSLCTSYWTPCRWISDETYGSCITASQAIFVTPPEMTWRMPTLGDGYEGRNHYPGQILH